MEKLLRAAPWTGQQMTTKPSKYLPIDFEKGKIIHLPPNGIQSLKLAIHQQGIGSKTPPPTSTTKTKTKTKAKQKEESSKAIPHLPMRDGSPK